MIDARMLRSFERLALFAMVVELAAVGVIVWEFVVGRVPVEEVSIFLPLLIGVTGCAWAWRRFRAMRRAATTE